MLTNKKLLFYVLLAIIVLSVFLLFRDSLARVVWQRYGSADVALILDHGDAGLFMQLGNYYFGGTVGKSEYKLEKAKTAYKKALALSPGILWGHYQLARIYFVKNDLNRALEEINQELKDNPANLRSLYVRGLIYGFQGNLNGAEEDFKRFTEWAPKEWAGYNDQAWILSSLGRFKEIKGVIQVAFQNVPQGKENPWLWNSLGVAELNLKEYPAARASFQNAERLALNLTPEVWRKAYPGNNPVEAEAGIKGFQKVIQDNLNKAEAVDKTL